jgi:hypothetical protein
MNNIVTLINVTFHVHVNLSDFQIRQYRKELLPVIAVMNGGIGNCVCFSVILFLTVSLFATRDDNNYHYI